jgi:hypothetical protein
MIIKKVLRYYEDAKFRFATEQGVLYIISKNTKAHAVYRVGHKMPSSDNIFLPTALRSYKKHCDKRGLFLISTSSNFMSYIREAKENEN